MKTFLDTIAYEYKKRYGDLTRITFVMPNKRSGAFLLKSFKEISRQAMVAPRIMAINEFVAELSDFVVASRLDLLFRLYRCYMSMPGADPEMTLEKFGSWGETILADFNEIDMQLADPEELFKNVYDLNSIRSNFLTEDQKKVMVEYFGYSPALLEVEYSRFWKDLEKDLEADSDGIRKKFHSMWSLLLPLYQTLKKELAEDGLSTAGGVYRDVAERTAAGVEPFGGEKIVFVGFNALSEAESSIFRSLKRMEVSTACGVEPKADFIWDMAPALFAQEEGPAMKFVNVNASRDRFPSPEWLDMPLRKSMPEKMPEIKVVSVPSNVLQTKVAAMELSSLQEKENVENDIKNARIAIVLPDENLLLPTLYSLPPRFSRPNLTMGFPLKQTPVIGFVSLLRKLHRGMKESKNGCAFFFEDVKDFLAHPYSRILFNREKTDKFIKAHQKARNLMVGADSLKTLGAAAETIFRGFPEKTPAGEIVSYLLKVMQTVKESIENDDKPGYLRARVECVYIGTYTDALIRLNNCMGQYGLVLSAGEVFSLADRLIAGENVVFDGRPLEGLQIMGVLETRCLDFDRIIMLSVNEKVMPRVGRNSTFIPNIIRSAFGMPPANYQEELFAYYFFRVLGRCRKAVLTYDSRASENRTPGPSRYLLQMKYLTANPELYEEEIRFDLPRTLKGGLSIEKNGELEEYLRQYYGDEGSKKFSASALGHYFHCPLRFLFNDVLGIYLEREPIETIDAIDMGTIVHETIEHLYVPEDKRGKFLERPLLITPDFLRGLLNENTPGRERRIEREARMSILKTHFGLDDDKLAKGTLRGSAAIIFRYITGFVRNIIKADLRMAPFRLWGSEIKETIPYRMKSGKTVYMKMVIDRLDQEGSDGPSPFRIVDYKTGKVHLNADSLSDVLEGKRSATNIFQLFFYAELLLLSIKKGDFKIPAGMTAEDFERNLKVLIYHVPSLPEEKGIMPPFIGTVTFEGAKKPEPRPVPTLHALREVEKEEGKGLMESLEEIIEEILNPDSPFETEPGDERCGICDFRLNCDVLRARRQSGETAGG